MNVTYNQKELDDLAAEAVGLGRQVAIRAETLRLGKNSKEVAFVSRCLAHLSERQAFHKADEGGFDAVMGILAYSGGSGHLFRQHPATCSGVSGHL